jgi:hypothetical protein
MVSLPTELTSAMNIAAEKVALDLEGTLTLACRQHIWAAMGPRLMDGNRAAFGIGLYRRATLAVASVTRVLPSWERTLPDDKAPHELIRIIDDYFKCRVDQRMLHATRRSLWCQVDELVHRGHGVEAMVGCAASCAAGTALVDEVFDPENLDPTASDLDRDAYQWDAGFYAAMVYAGGAPWNNDANVERRRQFWQWYIKEATPAAWDVDTFRIL